MTIGTDIGRQRRRLSGDGALEVALTAAFAVFTLVVSAAYGLPFALPGAESASAVKTARGAGLAAGAGLRRPGAAGA